MPFAGFLSHYLLKGCAFVTDGLSAKVLPSGLNLSVLVLEFPFLRSLLHLWTAVINTTHSFLLRLSHLNAVWFGFFFLLFYKILG